MLSMRLCEVDLSSSLNTSAFEALPPLCDEAAAETFGEAADIVSIDSAAAEDAFSRLEECLTEFPLPL